MNQLPAVRSIDLTLKRDQEDYILLDGSSSMRGKWWETIAAIETYVQGLVQANVNTHVTLNVFSNHDELEMIQRDGHIGQWVPLAQQPVGSTFRSTALYDAINQMCRRLRDMDPARCSIVIVTDGDENSSQITDLTQAKALLDWCRAKGWQVTFIGADFSNSQQAALLGANPHSAIGVQKKLLSEAAKSLATKRARYGLYGENMHFTTDEQQQFGGYLAAPEK